MADKECPYLIDASNGYHKIGRCNIDNNLCPYIRYCKDKKRIVSSPLYTITGCDRQKKYEMKGK